MSSEHAIEQVPLAEIQEGDRRGRDRVFDSSELRQRRPYAHCRLAARKGQGENATWTF